MNSNVLKIKRSFVEQWINLNFNEAMRLHNHEDKDEWRIEMLSRANDILEEYLVLLEEKHGKGE